MIGLWCTAVAAAPPEPPPEPVVIPTAPVPPSAIAEVLSTFGHEPSVADVQRWAAAHTHTSPAEVDRWLRQATRFAALPQTTVEWRLTDGFDQRFDYLGIDGAAVAPGTEALGVIDQASLDQAITYRVRLDWDLGNLVMSSERIRVIGEAQDLAELRAEVLEAVTRLYFERRRLQVERYLDGPGAELRQAVRDELRLEELTARLDGLTGGAFRRALR